MLLSILPPLRPMPNLPTVFALAIPRKVPIITPSRRSRRHTASLEVWREIRLPNKTEPFDRDYSMSHLSWGMVVLASGLICGQTGAQPQDTSLPERAVALPVLQNPGSAQAQPSRQPANPTVQPQPKLPSATTQPPPDQALSSLTAPSDSLSQAPTSGAEASAGFNPHMMGDQFGVFAIRNILVPSLRTTTVIQTNIQTTQTTVPFQTVVTVQQGQPIMVLDPDTGKFFVTPAPFTIQVPVSVPQTNTQTTTTQVPITTVSKVIVPTTVRIPVSSTGAFKIGENESPRPEDRAFFTYNFYSDVTGPFSGQNDKEPFRTSPPPC